MTQTCSKTIVYIKWKDASQNITDMPAKDIQLQILEEVAFLHLEDDEKVILSLESDRDDEILRLWMAIPKVNILERYEVDLGLLLKWMKEREKRKAKREQSVLQAAGEHLPEPAPRAA